MLVWGLEGNIFSLCLKHHFLPCSLHISNGDASKTLGTQTGKIHCRRKQPEQGTGSQGINSLAPGTKVLIDTVSQYLPRELGRATHRTLPHAGHTSSEHCVGRTSGRAPSQFRALLELVTLVLIAHLELQLCLKRSPQSKLGSPILLILAVPLLALIWKPLLITVDAVGRLGQENKALALPLPLTSCLSLMSQQFPFMRGDLEP